MAGLKIVIAPCSLAILEASFRASKGISLCNRHTPTLSKAAISFLISLGLILLFAPLATAIVLSPTWLIVI